MLYIKLILMDCLGLYILFYSILVISGLWKGVIKRHLGSINLAPISELYIYLIDHTHNISKPIKNLKSHKLKSKNFVSNLVVGEHKLFLKMR